VVAIGEAGLDYHYEHSPREAQERGFRNHIAAALATCRTVRSRPRGVSRAFLCMFIRFSLGI
jgi:Tat protein secretion system quality control protein TatD with DNase activity